MRIVHIGDRVRVRKSSHARFFTLGSKLITLGREGKVLSVSHGKKAQWALCEMYGKDGRHVVGRSNVPAAWLEVVSPPGE